MKRRTANPFSWTTALWSSVPHTDQKATELMNATRAALVRLLDGTAEDKHFMRLGVDINLAAIRAGQIGATQEVTDILNAAGEALKDCERFHGAGGRYGLTGPGRQHLAAGIDAYEAILRASSPRQMHLAEQELGRLLSRMEARAA